MKNISVFQPEIRIKCDECIFLSNAQTAQPGPAILPLGIDRIRHDRHLTPGVGVTSEIAQRLPLVVDREEVAEPGDVVQRIVDRETTELLKVGYISSTEWQGDGVLLHWVELRRPARVESKPNVH